MPNIAIIVLDTLRKDAFEEHFGWLDGRGRHFENAYSTSHWTIPAHASLFTGRYAGELGTHAKSTSLSQEHSTVFEKLFEAGYLTRFWSANNHFSIWNGWTKGVDDFHGPYTLDPRDEHLFNWSEYMHSVDGNGPRKIIGALAACIQSDAPTIHSLQSAIKKRRYGGSVNVRAGGTLRRIDQTEFGSDEFLCINLMDAHTPYYPEEKYRRVDKPVSVVSGDGFANAVDDPENIRRGYQGAVEYLSATCKQIHKRLVEDFEFIIYCSDHGELLGEHGMWNHGYGIYEELTHIPLVITGVKNETIETPVSILDVHKTIVGLTDISMKSRGIQLLKDIPERDLLLEYHGFIPAMERQFEERGLPESVYENHDPPLDGVVGPNIYCRETHDNGLVVDRGDECAAEDRLSEICKEIKRLPVENQDMDISESTRQQLEDLGYA